MSEETEVEIPMEEKFAALENQAYIMYLQLHAVIKLLTDKNIITQDEVSTEMEDLNKTLVQMTQDILEEDSKKAETEGPYQD